MANTHEPLLLYQSTWTGRPISFLEREYYREQTVEEREYMQNLAAEWDYDLMRHFGRTDQADGKSGRDLQESDS